MATLYRRLNPPVIQTASFSCNWYRAISHGYQLEKIYKELTWKINLKKHNRIWIQQQYIEIRCLARGLYATDEDREHS